MSTTLVRPATAANPQLVNSSQARRLLAALAISGPLWSAVSLVQAATRDGFDLTRHPLSMLSTGSLAWLQITNFVVAGALAVCGASGLREAVHSKWAPRLVAVYGVGYVLAGVFTLDPGDGFPAGTPLGAPDTMSWHAGLHLLTGTVSFVALTAALVVLGRLLLRRGDRRWAMAARLGAVAVIVADVAAMSGAPGPSVWIATGVIFAMLVLSAVAVKLRNELAEDR